jgi:hypothetical protein
VVFFVTCSFSSPAGAVPLESIDPNYPIFVLCFCIFKKSIYSSSIVNKLHDIKFKYFGHDNVVFHSHEIRKKTHNFSILNRKEIESEFLNDISLLIKNIEFKIISCVIDKQNLKKKYELPRNPYHLSLGFCLERLSKFLEKNDQIKLATHIVFEARGKKEDNELELEFRRTIDKGTKHMPKNMPFEILIADKKTNSIGLQIADLVAHPIGRKILHPDQNNQAVDIIEEKLLKNEKSEYSGIGIKIFP